MSNSYDPNRLSERKDHKVQIELSTDDLMHILFAFAVADFEFCLTKSGRKVADRLLALYKSIPTVDGKSDTFKR